MTHLNERDGRIGSSGRRLPSIHSLSTLKAREPMDVFMSRCWTEAGSRGVDSPTCDHVYEAPSVGQPNDAYTVTATSTWEITWTGGGTSGALTVTRSSTTTVRIGELQVLVTN